MQNFPAKVREVATAAKNVAALAKVDTMKAIEAQKKAQQNTKNKNNSDDGSQNFWEFRQLNFISFSNKWEGVS